MKEKMKKILLPGRARLRRALFIGMLLALALPAGAQTLNLNYGLVSKRANGATNAEVIFPANPNAIIRLLSYDVTGDAAGAILKLQGGTWSTTITTNALSTATNVGVALNQYIVAGDTIVFQRADNTVFSALVDTTNVLALTFTNQIGTALSVGDRVYRMGQLATNTIGAATVRKDG